MKQNILTATIKTIAGFMIPAILLTSCKTEKAVTLIVPDGTVIEKNKDGSIYMQTSIIRIDGLLQDEYREDTVKGVIMMDTGPMDTGTLGCYCKGSGDCKLSEPRPDGQSEVRSCDPNPVCATGCGTIWMPAPTPKPLSTLEPPTSPKKPRHVVVVTESEWKAKSN